MRVMVTGHLGYIGTVMVPMLVRSGHEVIGLDSNLYENCTFEAGGSIAAVPHIRKDIRVNAVNADRVRTGLLDQDDVAGWP